MATRDVEAVLDTSFVVGYLTDDPPDMAARAATVIDSKRVLGVPTVVLAEAWYVLQERYHAPREAVLDALLGLISRANIRVLHVSKELVMPALELCRPSGRVSIVDALIWVETRQAGIATVYTFDRRFPAVDLDVREG